MQMSADIPGVCQMDLSHRQVGSQKTITQLKSPIHVPTITIMQLCSTCDNIAVIMGSKKPQMYAAVQRLQMYKASTASRAQ